MLLVLVVACNRQPEPVGRGEAPAPAPSGSKADDKLPPAAFLAPPPARPSPAVREGPPLKWSDPAGWSRVASPSAMRLATYRVPREKGDPDDGEMTVFHFGGAQGGGIDANFDRWMGQFRGVDRSSSVRSERTVRGLSQHVLEIETGSFIAAMRPGDPAETAVERPNYGLLGAIVETPGGSYFFKLTGPKKTLKAARAAFFGLLDSVTLE
jgi:hypothetical protein